MKIGDLFELRGELSRRLSTVIGIVGFIGLILIWQSMAWFNLITESLLPSPFSVIKSFKGLHFEDELVRNCIYSIKLNLLGYIEAVAVAVPLGFVMGLFPIVRAATNQYIKALRFIPLAAATGVFIAWCGIGDYMKVQFLAVSIIVYLLPVVVQNCSQE